MTDRNITNELAKERTRQAAERTLTSWMQNCLTLIAFGFSYAGLTGRTPVGLSTVSAGVIVLAIVSAMHWRQLAALVRGDRAGIKTLPSGMLVSATVLFFGILALIGVLLRD